MLHHGLGTFVMVACHRWISAFPTLMFFAEDGPKVFGMGIAAVEKSFSAPLPHPLEGGIHITVARNQVISGLQLSFDPVVEPGMQAKAKRFRGEGGQRSGGSISSQANGRV